MGNEFLIHTADLKASSQVLRQIVGITRADDLHFTQHLVNDDFEVFIVDVLTLSPVNLLDLTEQILLTGIPAFDAQDGVRVQDLRSAVDRLRSFHRPERSGGRWSECHILPFP